MDRRHFLISAAGFGLLSFGCPAWAAGPESRLIVVLLRGAADGLNVVVPHGEAAYYEARPTIAIPRPGGEGGAIDLDGHFGLHPALEALMPYWRQKSLAFVHASGSPDPTRSHFDAQDFMESGTPGVKGTPDGWMNRLLSVSSPRSPIEAVSFGPTLPRIFSGKASVANFPLGKAASRPMPMDRPAVAEAFGRLYTGRGPLDAAYREGMASRRKLIAELRKDMKEADNGAPSPAGFPEDAKMVAGLMAGEVRFAFLSLGGWDTHVNENPQLANHLRPLGEGLAALAEGLGERMRDTVILVMSEFGRTVRENGNAGTDHGHGNAMWLLGGPVEGGKVHGEWPGLDGADLYQGRDLAVTTDFRSVAAAVLGRHLGLKDSQLDRVFPGFSGSLSRVLKS